MAHFRNDYSYLAHPRIFKALEEINDTEQVAYGLDAHSDKAADLIRKAFACPDASVHFLAGGTQANLVFLSGVLKAYEGVIACASGHINVHESAAVEGTGHKIFTLPGKDGKLSGSDIRIAMGANPDEHTVSLKAVYISDSTETGTIYSKAELLDLRQACDEYGLYLFIDGARLGSALTSIENDVEKELIAKVADGFTIGGTKNGLMLGEALVIPNPLLQRGFRNHIKNKGAMLAKGYMVGVQFEEAFKDGFYFELAKQTNETADLLKKGLKELGIGIAPSPTNQVFVELPSGIAREIIDAFGCELWEGKGKSCVIRFVTSFKTTKEDVDEAIAKFKEILSRPDLPF